MIKIPYDCPRGRKDCISLAKIESPGESFFCCGENNQKAPIVHEDKYTSCFKGEFRDEIAHFDKRDLIHNAAVLIQAVAVIQKAEVEDDDWSPWTGEIQ